MANAELLFFILKTPTFSHFLQQFGYVGILLWFLTLDQLTPIPEEVSLLIIGYLSAHQVFNPIIASAFCLAGFLIVDIAYFLLSQRGSSWIKKKTRGLSSLMKSYRNKLKTNSPKAIIILCFVPRMRMLAPILAGSMGLSFKKFILSDLIGLSLFTTVYVVLGLIFNKSLARLISKTKGMQHIIFFAAVIVIGVIILLFVIRRKRAKS